MCVCVSLSLSVCVLCIGSKHLKTLLFSSAWNDSLSEVNQLLTASALTAA